MTALDQASAATARTFLCWICGGLYERETDWTEEKAQAEMAANFGPDITADDCESVCDDCYSANFPELVKS